MTVPRTIRLPEDLVDRLFTARGRRSFNAEVVARLEASFVDYGPVLDTIVGLVGREELREAVAVRASLLEPDVAAHPVASGSGSAGVEATLPGGAPKIVGEQKTPGRDTKGAAKGLCSHRVPLDAFCARCG